MKKKLRGLTLMEVIVALAIYAVLALLLTEIMTLVNSTMRSTTHLNRRLAYESKFADIHDPNGGDQTAIGNAKVLYNNGKEIGLPASSTFEVEGNYPDEEAGDTKTNYHFMVIKKNMIDPATRPNHAFYLRLRVDIGANSNIDPLDRIIVDPGAATILLAPMPGTGFDIVPGSTDCISYKPADNDTTTGSMTIDVQELASRGLNWRQPFYIEIPLKYAEALDRDNPSNNNQTLKMEFWAHMRGSLYGQTYGDNNEYTNTNTYEMKFADLTLTYCTAQPFTNASGREDVQYYGIEGAGLNYGKTKDGANYIGAGYVLNSDGTITVDNH